MCEYDEKMVFPTIDDDGDGGRRMVGYEGYRFPEMSLDELEAYFLRCMKGAQSFVDEQGSDVDDSILSVLSTAGNALIVCRMMRHSLTEYERIKHGENTSSDLSGERGKHEPVREREQTGASPKMPSLSDMRTK